MKTNRITALAATVCAALISFAASAQNQNQNQNRGGQNSWKQKMQSEKVAFITMEVDLQPEEAQKFWPVYNQMSAKKDEARKAGNQAFKAMDKAVREGQSDKEISKLVDAYIKAQKALSQADENAVAAYGKVLPAAKVAKLILAEEHFRRNMFQKMHNGNHPANGQRPGGQPQGGRPQGGRPQAPGRN